MIVRHLRTALFVAALATAQIQPFSAYYDGVLGFVEENFLDRRQSSGSGWVSCSNVGASYAYCPAGTSCTLDQSSQVACCPSGAVCTGSLSGTAYYSASSGSGASTGTGNVQPTGSIYSNSYYNFYYAPTSFSNQQACYNAVSTCNAQSASCFATLVSANGIQITVSIGGPGATLPNNAGGGATAVSSICGSISSVACYNLNSASCGTVTGGGGGSTTGSSSSGSSITGAGVVTVTVGAGGGTFVQNAGPRKTACPGMVYAAGAGAMVGLMGALA